MRFGGGKSDWWVNQPEGVAQAVVTRLRLYKGDYFLDNQEGTDWRGRVLGKNTRGVHDLELRSRILRTTGLAGLPVYRSTLDGDTRRLSVQGTIETIYGPAPLAAPVFVAAPTVPANQVLVPLQGADADFLFGFGGEDLAGTLVPPRVADHEAGRIPYGALLDDLGFLVDGFGHAVIAALGVPPSLIPANALIDGAGDDLADGFGNVLVAGDGLAPAVALLPLNAILVLAGVATAAASAIAELHRPSLVAASVAGTTQLAALHRPQLAALAAGSTSQSAVIHLLKLGAVATGSQSARLASRRAQQAPATAVAAATATLGRINNPAHRLTAPAVAAGSQNASPHSAWRIAAAAALAGSQQGAELISVRHLSAPASALATQDAVLSI